MQWIGNHVSFFMPSPKMSLNGLFFAIYLLISKCIHNLIKYDYDNNGGLNDS